MTGRVYRGVLITHVDSLGEVSGHCVFDVQTFDLSLDLSNADKVERLSEYLGPAWDTDTDVNRHVVSDNLSGGRFTARRKTGLDALAEAVGP